MNDQTPGTGQGQTDGAALGAGVVGVAVTMVMEPGPFNYMGVAIAVTLGLVIVGYMGAHRRTIMQSIAFAAALGVITMPIYGVLREHSKDEKMSTVSLDELAVTWLVATIIAAVIDRFIQHRRARASN